MAISIDQISFETKQKKKIRLISILFLFQLKKIILEKYPKLLEENPGTYQNVIAHVL